MAIGLIFGRTEAKDEKVNKTMALASELHDIFRTRHKTLCCRILTKNMELGSLNIWINVFHLPERLQRRRLE